MRRIATTAVMLGTLLGGCMAPPEAEDLVLAERETADAFDLCSIPDGERPAPAPPTDVVEPEPEPIEPAPTRSSGPPRFIPDRGPDACWGVKAQGFPAISTDGRTVVVPEAQHLQLSDTPGDLALRWLDTAAGTVTRTDPVITDSDWGGDEECDPAGRRSLRRSARATNRALAEGSWRTMEPLPIDLFYPDTYMIEVYLEEFSPRERAPQLIVQHGEAIVRVPGVEVLERHPIESTGEPYAVYGDRHTGTVVLVTMACNGESCTCDPRFSAQVLHWQPSTFEAIERRPCDRDGTGDEGENYCDPIDYGFGTGDDAWSF